MGLLQQAIKTYDFMDKIGLVGKYEEGKEPLAPIGHILANPQIQITLNKNSEFVSAEKIDKKIIIPVTEESSGRTSSAVAHPLCDSIGYISGIDEEKYDLYISALKEWSNSSYGDGKLRIILEYVQTKKIIKNLEESGLIKRNNDGKVENDKDIICWRIIGLNDGNPDLYKDVKLMNKYKLYYTNKKNDDPLLSKEICFISGDEEIKAIQHLKGVVSLNGNAKLISSNDSTNFTYRGRFFVPEEALSIGYFSSQKAHNVIKWLVSNQKVVMGKRVLICWNPNGKELPSTQSPLLARNSEKKIEPSNYKKELQSILYGFKKVISVYDDVVIASFDAATTGRLSISYYNELKESDFLDRLEYWDLTCCWYSNKYGVYSPSLREIIDCTFGYQRGNDDISKLETSPEIISQHMQRLISCRLDKKKIPIDILKRLVNNSNNLQIYNDMNRRRILFTACSIIKKYKNDYEKEEVEMALDVEKKDRSYQYGRLLAVLEKIEKDTYDKGDSRETNAIRMQSVFVKRPAYTTKIVLEQLKNSYYPKLKPGVRVYYDKTIGQIMDVISEFDDYEYNKPLTETYLLGYYLQQNNMYSKKEEEEEKENE